MKNILVATDLSPNSDRAIERAISISKNSGAKLHLVHVTDAVRVPGRGKAVTTLQTELLGTIRNYLDTFKGADDVAFESHVISGDVFSEIIQVSSNIDADLIVMGMHNKVGFKDLFVGTTVERVIRKGVKPVLMVKKRPKDKYFSVVAGCDFSASSHEAFQTVLKLAPEAKYKLIHAYDFPDTSAGDKMALHAGEIVERLESERLERYLESARKYMTKVKVSPENLSYETLKGQPFEVLKNAVKAERAGLLAVGVHSRSTLTHSKLGGVTHDLLINPPCDVLVAKGLTTA